MGATAPLFCCCSITLTVGHKTIQRILTLMVQLQSCALVRARYRVLPITLAIECLHADRVLCLWHVRTVYILPSCGPGLSMCVCCALITHAPKQVSRCEYIWHSSGQARWVCTGQGLVFLQQSLYTLCKLMAPLSCWFGSVLCL